MSGILFVIVAVYLNQFGETKNFLSAFFFFSEIYT